MNFPFAIPCFCYISIFSSLLPASVVSTTISESGKGKTILFQKIPSAYLCVSLFCTLIETLGEIGKFPDAKRVVDQANLVFRNTVQKVVSFLFPFFPFAFQNKIVICFNNSYLHI
jgi:hypothetical protein